MFLARALLMIVESRTSGASLVWTQALYTCFACQSLSGGKLIYASQHNDTIIKHNPFAYSGVCKCGWWCRVLFFN